ncbi:MAG: hypothetical protein ACOYKZ_05785 [Chlamydiia bacterium]
MGRSTVRARRPKRLRPTESCRHLVQVSMKGQVALYDWLMMGLEVLRRYMGQVALHVLWVLTSTPPDEA